MLASPRFNLKKISSKFQEWDLYSEQSFDYLLEKLPPGEFELHKILDVTEVSDTDFILPLYLGPVLVSVAIFPKDMMVIVGSLQFSREFFLYEQVQGQKYQLIEASSHEELFFRLMEKISGLKFASAPMVISRIEKRFQLIQLQDEKLDDVYKRAQTWYDRIQKSMLSHKSSWFEKLSDGLLGLTAKYGLLRIHLLKFLALLPSLDHDKEGKEVKRLLLEALRRLLQDHKVSETNNLKGDRLPLPKILALVLVPLKTICEWIPAPVLARIVRDAVRFQAKRFIAGESIANATQSLKDLRKSRREATLDQLGELVVSQKEADGYCQKVCELITGLKEHIPPGTKNKTGILCAHVSIKVSALCPDFRAQAFDYVYAQISPRLKRIFELAKQEQVFINIDAEHYHYRDSVLSIYRKVLLDHPEFRNWDQTGIVIQAYLRDGAQHLKDVLNLAQERARPMPVRLVKGAYWDAETIEAKAHHFPAPQFLNKEETDIHFRQLAVKILENHRHLKLCLASHNLSDHAFAEAYRELRVPGAPEIEHQCLHMTYEALSTALAREKLVVRNYVPVGSLLVGMAYLVRRIMENSSQVGILAAMRSQKLAKKISRPEIQLQKIADQNQINREALEYIDGGFHNVTPLRPYRVGEWSLYQKQSEVESWRQRFCTGEKKIYSPGNPEKCVGSIHFLAAQEISPLIEKLHHAHLQGHWRKYSSLDRSSVMLKAAQKLYVERNEWASLIVEESGKAILEALADVDEAIDFLNFYARQEVQGNFRQQKRARGPFAVICPWNFPLAIPLGMAVGALVTGNPVALKSAEQTPLIAQKLVDLLHWAGVPEDVLIHFPGDGEVGKALVDHSSIAGIVFTGSKAVGQSIFKNASARIYRDPVSQLSYPVKVVTEMGGKNAIIVTANAELDETVNGILYSSFAHAGQKCSAASRVLVDQGLLDAFCERFTQAVNDLKVDSPQKASCYINPVISEEDQQRLRSQIREASLEVETFKGKILVDRSQDKLPGYCVGPAVFVLPHERAIHPDSYARRELFGPVVHIIPFSNLNQAVELFNCVEYGLTGGIFSQSQDDIDYLSSRLQAGNLYINRGCTGARVGIEPFGGFKLSGTGPKAGGRQYLESFYAPLVVSDLELGERISRVPGRELTLSQPLSWTGDIRERMVIKALARISQRDTDLFVWENKQTLIKNFKRWFEGNLGNWANIKHPNVRVPGQLSFDDYQLKRKRGVMVPVGVHPHLSSLFYLCGALFNGAGVSIWCQGIRAFEGWSRLIEEFRMLGVPSSSLEVTLASGEQILSGLKHHDIEFLIIDGPFEGAQNLVEQYTAVERRQMGVVLSSQVIELTSAPDFVMPFVYPRSFAINIMRHGAPMELDL